MAGASAVGGFVSLDAEESFAIEYWPLELYKLSLAPPPGELQGSRRAGDRGRRRHRARDRGRRWARRRLRRRVRPRRRRRRGGGRRPRRARGGARRRRHERGGRRGPPSPLAVERFGGVDIVVSNAGVASSAAIEETTLDRVAAQPRDPRHRLLPRRPRGVPAHARPGPRRIDRLRRVQERAGGPRERVGVLLGQGGRAAPGPVPRRGGRGRGIRVNTVNPDAVLQGSRIWDSRGARSAPPLTASRPTTSRSTTVVGRRSASTSSPPTSRRPCCTSPRPRARGRAPATCSTSTAASPPPTRGRDGGGSRPVRVALLITCFNDTLFPGVGRAVVELLERLGCEVRSPRSRPAAARCTATPATATRRSTWRGASPGSSPARSSSCARRPRAPAWLRELAPRLAADAGDEPLRAELAALGSRLRELTELLVDDLGVEDVGASFPHRVTYHPTCHSLRAARRGRPPAAAAAGRCAASTWSICPRLRSAAGSAAPSP